MADQNVSLNPGDDTAADADYDAKFNRRPSKDDLKDKEKTGGEAEWKTTTEGKKTEPTKKGVFKFAGRHSGRLRQGSAFAFIIVMLGLGVWYTSIFAPNILLVNIKEMYTNDLSDSTIALDTYYKKLLNYKIGRPQCGEQESIKCKLSTMSRAQKKAFEKHGFTVIGTKVKEDNRDDGQPGNEQPESRYQVVAIIPPAKSPGVVATGDMLWLYGQQSMANKSLVNSVFNAKSSFYMDTRFKQVLKSRYNMTKTSTTAGNTTRGVDRSFDNSVRNGGGIDITGRPSSTNGISLGALSNPITIAQLELAMAPLAAQATSFVDLQCILYSFGKNVTNNAKSAKAATLARFALQYLKAADQIKAGTSNDITINTLSAKLAQSTIGGYRGVSATEASMYKSITYGDLPVPSIFGLLYYLDTFDLIGAMLPAWSMIMSSAAQVGAASNVQGSLLMPPANLTGTDRDYCLGGETIQNHSAVKMQACNPQIAGSATPGTQPAMEPLTKLGRQTCLPPHYSFEDNAFQGLFLMQPTVKATTAIQAPVVAAEFGANVVAWANIMQLLFTSQTKGMAASDAIFAGTGQVMGDMAMSRGMMPGNVVSMTEYLAQKPALEKEYDDIARYNAKQNPFDAYNSFSFLGSILHGLNPVYSDKAPLMATISNAFSLLGNSVQRLNPSANAIYYHQPAPFNPLRLTCPDPEYLAILITADTACNVRYSVSRLELAAQIDTVIDYMTQTHSDNYKDRIQELTQRLVTADPEITAANVGRMLAQITAVSNQPFIDKKTGKAIPGSDYDKYLQYCVNRADPWGRSGIHTISMEIPEALRQYRLNDKTNTLEGIGGWDSGDPYQNIGLIGFPSVTEGAKAEQDWYTGKKCLEQSEMLTNFRAYTLACSVDGTLSGGLDCSDTDNSNIASYSNDFFSSNDILFIGG